MCAKDTHGLVYSPAKGSGRMCSVSTVRAKM